MTAKNQEVSQADFQRLTAGPFLALKQDARMAIEKSFLSKFGQPAIPNQAPALELRTADHLRVDKNMASDGYYDRVESTSQNRIGNRESMLIRLSSGDDVSIKRLVDLSGVEQLAEVDLFFAELFGRGLIVRAEMDEYGDYDPLKLSEAIFIKTATRRETTVERDSKGLSRVRGEVPLYGDVTLRYSVRRNGQTSFKLSRL